MPKGTLVWDGARRLGPVELGMPLAEVVAVIPGSGSFDADDDDDPPYYWYSDELGLSVQFWREVAVAITAKREFILDDVNIIGMPTSLAVERAGGEVARDVGDPIDFVSTAAGLELYDEDDRVVIVVLSDDTHTAR